VVLREAVRPPVAARRSPDTLPRIDRPDPECFHQGFAVPGRPALITGIVDRWRAFSLWSPEHFGRTLPDLDVTVEVWEGDPIRDAPAALLKSVRRETMLLKAFCDRPLVPAAPRSTYYLAQYPIFRSAPSLRDDVDPPADYMRVPRRLPAALSRRLISEPTIWVGPADSVTTAHFDLSHNLFCQIAGAKKVLLFPPEQSGCLHCPHAPFARGLHFSPVNVEHPDLDAFPRFRDARPVEVTVRAGEMLFIPAGWWHYLRALQPSISLNFWWDTWRTLRRAAPHMLRAWLARWTPRAVAGGGETGSGASV
jgi:[protein]-arginine 3-hydroxylase / protease